MVEGDREAGALITGEAGVIDKLCRGCYLFQRQLS